MIFYLLGNSKLFIKDYRIIYTCSHFQEVFLKTAWVLSKTQPRVNLKQLLELR